MKNYLLLAGGLVLTIGICVAVIHYEAVQTREAMREMAQSEIPKGVRDGIDDSMGGVGKRIGDAVHVADEVQSAIGSVVNGRRADGSIPSLPETAGSAAKVAGDLVGQMRDTLTGSPTDGTSQPADKANRRPGGLLGDLRSTIGDVLGTPPGTARPDRAGAEEPKSSASDDAQPAKKGSADSRKRGNGESDADRSKADKPVKSDSTGDRSDADPADDKDSTRRTDSIGNVLDLASTTVKAGDSLGQRMFGLTPQEERDWGKRLHEQLLEDVQVVHDRALAKRIERITKPILSACRRQDIQYTFTVIKSDDDDINAFSIVGGYIYIHTALIKFVKNDQELQFVLAHEIAHVDLGHCTRQLTYVARATELATPVAGNLVGLLHSLLTRPYSREQEFEADAYGYKAVLAAGQTRQQALAFVRRFAQYVKDKGLEEPSDAKDDQGPAGAVISRVKDHFHTHPPMDERLRRLEAIDDGQSSKK